MKKIYKYELKITDKQVIKMPIDYKILCAKNQNGFLVIYAQVETDYKLIPVQLELIGTGNAIEEPEELFAHWVYIDTVMMDNGLVWHVYNNLAPF